MSGKITKWLIGVCLFSLIVQIYFRFNLSLNRYFDVDEYAHLHWAYSTFIGNMPYRDFFYIFPSYFLFPVGIIISIFGRSMKSLLLARGFIFMVQIMSYLILFLWAKKLRGILTALLTLLIFIFLPLPSDKLLEIRPDLLAAVLAMSGLYLFVLAYDAKKARLFFFSGFLLSASIAFVPKTIFFLIPVLIVLLLKFRKNYLFFGLGLFLNFLVITGFYLLSGKFWQAVYLTTKLASDVTKTLSLKFYMRPDIFFYPNDTYYGMPGVSQTLIVNLLIYILGCLWGIKKLISAFSHEDKQKGIREFVFVASLFANLFAFVRVFPLKHLQYLIPVAPFVAFYFADLLITLLNKARIKFFKMPLLAVFIIYITFLSWKMYVYKLPWNNKQTLDNLNRVLAAIPANQPIFDLTGETIFYPDGYYFCCLPYGQYEENLNFNYPELDADMERRKTDYVYIGKAERLGVLPAVQARYIRENFKESEITGILVRSDKK